MGNILNAINFSAISQKQIIKNAISIVLSICSSNNND